MSDVIPTKFHLSLNVSDLGRAIEFYQVLFGTPPAKSYPDYAKFEVEDPPVIFSLSPRAAGPGASLSHLGLRVISVEALLQAQERLAAAGISTTDQNGTICGYARQDKVWARDPDGNFWEIYHLEENVDPASVRRALDGAAARPEAPAPTAARTNWEHYITAPFEGIPHPDGALDEVLLTGTLNGSLDAEGRLFAFREAYRALKPGGSVVTHGLMSDAPISGSGPELPGMAAMVSRVPDRAEAEAVLQEAGFVGIQIQKLTPSPWFVHEGIGLREVKLLGWKPVPVAEEVERAILYKGPFAEAVVDGGRTFRRGERVAVSEALWQQLRLGSSVEQFLFFEPGQGCGCG